LITIDPNSKIKRDDVIQHLNNKKIGTRLLFGGDIRKQPAFKGIKYKGKEHLKNTEIIMNNAFWIGTTPAINNDMIEHIIESFKNYD
jgi:CDP-6-deoxy-D-xylo-4-hexulose-3-dehydrase